MSRLPRCIAATSALCLNRVAFRKTSTSNRPGSTSSTSFSKTCSISACQSPGTAGVEILIATGSAACRLPKPSATPEAMAHASMQRILLLII